MSVANNLRLWSAVQPVKDLSFRIDVGTSPRYYWRPETLPDALVWDGAAIERIALKWANPLALPLTVEAGRRAVRMHPDQTSFYDTVRAALDAKQLASELDVTLLTNRVGTSWLTNPWTEPGVIPNSRRSDGFDVHLATTALPDSRLEGYLSHRRQQDPLRRHLESNLNLLGLRITRKILNNIEFRAEAAPQTGLRAGREVRALGLNEMLFWNLPGPLGACLRLGHEYRSGGRSRFDGFDPHWGGYGWRWAESLGAIASLDGPSGRPGNYHRFQLGWRFRPADGLDVAADYHLLLTDTHPMAGRAGFDPTGRVRGQLFAAQLHCRLTEHVTTRLRAEVFLPGDYYDDSRNDVAALGRYELVLTW